MRRPKGSILILCLLLMIILLVLGLGFLGKRSIQYKASFQALATAKSKAIAEAGMAEALAKLEKDFDFPPPGALEQLVFSYSETIHDLNTSLPVGQYRVTVDHRWIHPPYSVIKLHVAGTDGTLDNPSALYQIESELQVTPISVDPTVTSFELVNWKESASY